MEDIAGQVQNAPLPFGCELNTLGALVPSPEPEHVTMAQAMGAKEDAREGPE